MTLPPSYVDLEHHLPANLWLAIQQPPLTLGRSASHR